MNLKALNLRGWLMIAALLGISAAGACSGSQPEELTIPVTVDGEVMTPETITVKQDDMVTLRIRANQAGEFHLHTYDIEMDIESEGTTDFFFVAEATGRFRITYHPSGSHEEDDADHEEGEAEGEHNEDDDEDEVHEEGEEVDIGFLEVNPR